MGKLEGVNGLVLEGDIPASSARGITLANGATVGTPEGLTFSVKEQLDTPDAVYRATRDARWLCMPEPCEDEIYMLMEIFGESELLAFKVTGCDYTVSVGSVENGKFIASRSSDVTGGNTYEDEILASESVTECHQVMVKIAKKENDAGSITKFEIEPHSAHSNSNFSSWNVVEIWANVPSATAFYISNTSNAAKRLNRLKYLRIAGDNSFETLGQTCALLQNLTAVLELDTSNVPDGGFANFCYDCPRLLAIGPVTIGETVHLSYSFGKCGLKKVEFLDGENICAVNNSTFLSSSAMEEIVLDTSGVTDDFELSKLFSLKSFTMDTTSLVGAAEFSNLYSLSSLTFTTNANVPESIKITNCGLSYAALLETLASIPQASEESTLTLTGTRGAAELTADDIASMTAKNWTVVI